MPKLKKGKKKMPAGFAKMMAAKKAKGGSTKGTIKGNVKGGQKMTDFGFGSAKFPKKVRGKGKKAKK